MLPLRMGFVRSLAMTLGIWVFTTQGALSACLGDQNSEKEYTFAVVPQLPPKVLYQNWSPFLTSVGQSIGVCFDLKIEDNIPEFEGRLLSDRYDFAYMNPYHAYLAKEAGNYDPFIVDNARRLTGIVVVRADSDLETIEDLAGKTVAFPAPNAFGASLLVRGYLKSHDIEITPVYRETHSNVYRQTARGLVDAGGGVNNTLLREEDNLRAALRILFTTKGYVSHPISASPQIDAETKARFTEAVLALSTTEAGQKILEKVQLPKPRASTYEADFAGLADLKLKDITSAIGER